MKKNIYKLELDGYLLECSYCGSSQYFPEKKEKLKCIDCDEYYTNWIDPIKIDLAMHIDHYNSALERYEAGIELEELDRIFKIKD